MQRKAADRYTKPANTAYQRHGDDAKVARTTQINPPFHDRFQADSGNRAEQQHHDAAHHRHRDGLQQSAKLPDKGHQYGKPGRPGHHYRIKVLGQHHSSGYLTVRGNRRAAEQADDIDRQTIIEQRAMQTGRFREILAGHRTDRQNAAHYPTLDLVGSYNSEDTDGTLYGGGSQIDNTKVMLKLNVPLYQGGMVSSKAAEAEHQRSAARQELIRQTRAVERQTRSAFLGVKTALNRVEALHQSVASNQSALEAKQEGFLSGLYTSLAVLDAERDLYLTKQEYAKARYQYLLNGLKLKKATDTLSGQDIQQMAQLFR